MSGTTAGASELTGRGPVLLDRAIAVALCQGAVLYFLDGQTGVEDFDVWTFYAAYPGISYPLHRRTVRDLGYEKFGRASGYL